MFSAGRTLKICEKSNSEKRHGMELSYAIEKANQILDEERSCPTVGYSLNLEALKSKGPMGETLAMVSVLTEPQKLEIIRSRRPRQIEEDTRKWGFRSVNYNLLCALLSRLPEASRSAFLSAVMARLASVPGCAKSGESNQPNWRGYVSEFPAVAEFCVRNGAKFGLLKSLGESQCSIGLAVLLRHLEDMIALNFTVFAEPDYKTLTMAMSSLLATARKEFLAYQAEKRQATEPGLWAEIISATNAIIEECRKASYLYLRGVLLEGLNLEVNQDKAAVEGYLKGQGFSDQLVECLNQADRIYHSAAGGFDFKICMGHLRSFIERLHSEGIAKRQAASPAETIGAWGDGLHRLQEEGVLTKAEELFAAAVYRLLSDAGVHPIIAEKEYARLARNVVIEYGLLFLRKLEKLGPKRVRAGSV